MIDEKDFVKLLVKFLNVFLGILRVVLVVYGIFFIIEMLFNDFCFLCDFSEGVDLVWVVGGLWWMDVVLKEVINLLVDKRWGVLYVVVFVIMGE